MSFLKLEPAAIFLSLMLLCGGTAYKLARDTGRRPLPWFLVGFSLPLIGVGILLIIQRKRLHL